MAKFYGYTCTTSVKYNREDKEARKNTKQYQLLVSKCKEQHIEQHQYTTQSSAEHNAQDRHDQKCTHANTHSKANLHILHRESQRKGKPQRYPPPQSKGEGLWDSLAASTSNNSPLQTPESWKKQQPGGNEVQIRMQDLEKPGGQEQGMMQL